MHAPYKYIILGAILCALLALTGVAVNAQDDAGSQTLRRINQARADANLPALSRNAQLDAAAQGHADDLLRHGAQLGHSGSDGSTIAQRIARAGYNAAAEGENWASYRSLDLVVNFWLTDPPHRYNILNANFREIGIGVAMRANGGLIIVTDFGNPGSGGTSNVARAAAAPKKAAPTKASAPAKPKPTVVPTRKPTRKPTAVPTPLPTHAPPAKQIALAQPPPKPVVIARVHARAKSSRLILTGTASVHAGLNEMRGDGTRQFFGGALAFGGMLLLGIAMIGQRRRYLRS
jgi:Cysteine-rich secretory protein family